MPNCPECENDLPGVAYYASSTGAIKEKHCVFHRVLDVLLYTTN